MLTSNIRTQAEHIPSTASQEVIGAALGHTGTINKLFVSLTPLPMLNDLPPAASQDVKRAAPGRKTQPNLTKLDYPRCKREVGGFLGSIQYFAKHIKSFHTISAPLRKLTSNKN